MGNAEQNTNKKILFQGRKLKKKIRIAWIYQILLAFILPSTNPAFKKKWH